MRIPLLYCFVGPIIESLPSKRDDAFCLSSLRGVGSTSRRLERQKYIFILLSCLKINALISNVFQRPLGFIGLISSYLPAVYSDQENGLVIKHQSDYP